MSYFTANITSLGPSKPVSRPEFPWKNVYACNDIIDLIRGEGRCKHHETKFRPIYRNCHSRKAVMAQWAVSHVTADSGRQAHVDDMPPLFTA